MNKNIINHMAQNPRMGSVPMGIIKAGLLFTGANLVLNWNRNNVRRLEGDVRVAFTKGYSKKIKKAAVIDAAVMGGIVIATSGIVVVATTVATRKKNNVVDEIIDNTAMAYSEARYDLDL